MTDSITNRANAANHSLIAAQRIAETGVAKPSSTSIGTPLPPLTSSDTTGLPARRAPNAQEAEAALAGLKDLPKIKFSITQLLSLMLQLANKQRRAMRESRIDDANIAESLMHEAADDIRQSARDQLAGGIIGAGFKMAAASITAAGAAKAGNVENQQEMMTKSMAYQSAGQAVGSIGEVGNSAMQYESGLDQAERTEAEAASQKTQAIEDSDKSDAEDETQLIQSIIQTFQKEEESRHDAIRATA